MKDLCEQTGLERQVIHFYIQQGLVPEGHKTGRNMAYYGPEHLERLRLVRRLARERFLPLKAIRAVLNDEEASEYSDEQRAHFLEVKQLLGERLGAGDAPLQTTDADELLHKHGVERHELEVMARIGMLSMVEEGGRTLVASDDAWMIELWGRLRKLGFSKELGFDVEELAMFEEAISSLFEKEATLMAPRLAHLPADQVADMVDQALPLVNEFLARYHLTKARNFFAALG